MTSTAEFTVTGDFAKAMRDATKNLTRLELLVGIPGDTAPRAPAPGEKTPPSNALIGYVQEYGDDERHIPARPFLLPGVEAARAAIVGELAAAGIVALHGGSADQIKAHFDAAGLIAQASVKKALLNGTFAPLSERTLEARARRRTEAGKLSQAEPSKAARRELKNRAAGALATTDAKPLYDTRSLFNAITSVVARDRARVAGTAAVAAALGL